MTQANAFCTKAVNRLKAGPSNIQKVIDSQQKLNQTKRTHRLFTSNEKNWDMSALYAIKFAKLLTYTLVGSNIILITTLVFGEGGV